MHVRAVTHLLFVVLNELPEVLPFIGGWSGRVGHPLGTEGVYERSVGYESKKGLVTFRAREHVLRLQNQLIEYLGQTFDNCTVQRDL